MLEGKDARLEGNMDASEIPLERTGSEEVCSTLSVNETITNDCVQDMAGTILYLCSRAGAYLDGTSILSDGGRLSLMPASY